jgi:hypothetical protein
MDRPGEDGLKGLLRRSRLVRQLTYRYQLSSRRPHWRDVMRREHEAWSRARAAIGDGSAVLIATSVGALAAATNLESVLGVALTLRGVRVEFLLCDGVLPACQNCLHAWAPSLEDFARHGPARDRCAGCFAAGRAAYGPLDLPIRRYGDLLDEASRGKARAIAAEVPLGDIPFYEHDGFPVGEHAMAGALRFYGRGDVTGEPCAESVVRRYLEASLVTVSALHRLFATRRYRCAVVHHGIYVPQGLVAEAARRHGVRVVSWNPAYRKGSFIFSHGDTYHHTLLSEPVGAWEHLPWTHAMERRLLAYLKSRARGTEDWIWFHNASVEDRAAIERQTGLDFSRPCIALLTNVVWDAQLHYPARAFRSMMEWILETIRYFARRPDLQLAIRVHPAELRGEVKSRQPVADEIGRAFPALPSNVVVIGPASPVSTYALAEHCDAVVVYGTKTGVELTSVGIPILVAGEAWIRNKGLTVDVATARDYVAALDTLPWRRRLAGEELVRARKYAYHFFFRRMIPIDSLEMRGPRRSFPPYRARVARLDDLRPGRSPGLDIVCDGILTGADFVYPAEREAEGSGSAAGASNG